MSTASSNVTNALIKNGVHTEPDWRGSLRNASENGKCFYFHCYVDISLIHVFVGDARGTDLLIKNCYKCVTNGCDGACGQNAACRVIRHIPVCKCRYGYTGNAYINCRIDCGSLDPSDPTVQCSLNLAYLYIPEDDLFKEELKN